MINKLARLNIQAAFAFPESIFELARYFTECKDVGKLVSVY
jgi:hypothetical protein